MRGHVGASWPDDTDDLPVALPLGKVFPLPYGWGTDLLGQMQQSITDDHRDVGAPRVHGAVEQNEVEIRHVVDRNVLEPGLLPQLA